MYSVKNKLVYLTMYVVAVTSLLVRDMIDQIQLIQNLELVRAVIVDIFPYLDSRNWFQSPYVVVTYLIAYVC